MARITSGNAPPAGELPAGLGRRRLGLPDLGPPGRPADRRGDHGHSVGGQSIFENPCCSRELTRVRPGPAAGRALQAPRQAGHVDRVCILLTHSSASFSCILMHPCAYLLCILLMQAYASFLCILMHPYACLLCVLPVHQVEPPRLVGARRGRLGQPGD